MEIKHYFDAETWTLTYLVYDPKTRDAVVIDPVLDYDPLASTTHTRSVDLVTADVRDKDLKLHCVLETHAHADHLSGSQLLKQRFGADVVIGHNIVKVQALFKGVLDLAESFKTDGSQFDRLLADNQVFEAGSISVKALPTPGHTPACMSYLIGDAVFTGDALFMEDYGTGRCDFPAGSSKDLYASIHEVLYGLPDATRVFVGHDYLPGGRSLKFESTIGAEKAKNVQLAAGTQEGDFVSSRDARDASLAAPRLIFQSVQVNINAGKLPEAHGNGIRYLRVPLNLRRPTNDAGDPVELEAAE